MVRKYIFILTWDAEIRLHHWQTTTNIQTKCDPLRAEKFKFGRFSMAGLATYANSARLLMWSIR